MSFLSYKRFSFLCFNYFPFFCVKVRRFYLNLCPLTPFYNMYTDLIGRILTESEEELLEQRTFKGWSSKTGYDSYLTLKFYRPTVKVTDP